jgi:hypothetical protein
MAPSDLPPPSAFDDTTALTVADHEARLQAAALAQALQAEQEAATAAQECDVVAERVRAALAR